MSIFKKKQRTIGSNGYKVHKVITKGFSENVKNNKGYSQKLVQKLQEVHPCKATCEFAHL